MAPCGNEHPLECAQVTSEVAHVTHVDRVSFSSQHGRGHVLAADGVLDSLLGMVQALLRPGTLRASSMRRTSSSVEIVSGVKWRKTDLAVSGAHEEYQVGTRRHSERGLRMTSVSSMDSGAGSVELSARPAF